MLLTYREGSFFKISFNWRSLVIILIYYGSVFHGDFDGKIFISNFTI